MKIRLDYSAHISVVVNVPGENLDELQYEAMKIAENYLSHGDVFVDWELEDGGVDEEDESCPAVNDY